MAVESTASSPIAGTRRPPIPSHRLVREVMTRAMSAPDLMLATLANRSGQ